MQITILCSDRKHPIYPYLVGWKAATSEEVHLVHSADEVGTGDILFLISCQTLIGPKIRDRFAHTLVVHASDLPRGRGWSPLVHELLAGATRICVSLLEAEDAVDSGAIWKKQWIEFVGNEVHDEIHAALSLTTTRLMDFAVEHAKQGPAPQAQSGEPTFYPKRTPADSEVAPSDRLEDIFDLLRLADHKRYPVYFNHRGRKYKLALESYDD